MKIAVEQLNESVKRYKVLKDKPVRKETSKKLTEEKLIKAVDKNITENVVRGNMLGDKENMAKRMEMLDKIRLEPAEFAFERAIGENDSVYSNFVELISYSKQKVGRIVVKEGNKKLGYATGFMVSERLMLTNWHVFRKKEEVAQSEVEFYYEYDMFGRSAQPVVFRLSPNDFFYSFKELDYCFVAVNPVDVSGTVKLSSIGYIYLDPSLGKLGNEKEELLNLIHHPGGDYKQLSIRKNEFTKIMATTIWYKSDTAQGSSGSPVFNDQWQIVALHHMGVPDMTPDGKHYLDKKGKIVPVVDGEVDETRINWIANEGIRISVILKDIFTKYPNSAFIDALKVPLAGTTPVKKSGTTEVRKEVDQQPVSANAEQVNISFPVSLMLNSGNVSINVNNNTGGATGTAKVVSDARTGFIEIKKEDRENAVDFSACEGYEPGFMGVNIALPTPTKTLGSKLAKLEDGSTELKYFLYSVLFNSSTMLPALSAINVEGDPSLRLDNSKRSDIWLRDKRILKDTQFTDNYYAGSGFDKGHMSRFEDANWAQTEEEALRNGIYTCFYTNASPQVPGLNRAGGVWGKLEKALLEGGVKKESGALGRISVFNGPIHNKSLNRKFRGHMIPMEFFKIIIWRNDDDEIKATGFKLSQVDLVKSITFDESLDIRAEAIDIDTNAAFKEYQVRLSSLRIPTGFDFSPLYKYDTYNKVNTDESLIRSEGELEALIKRNSRKKKR